MRPPARRGTRIAILAMLPLLTSIRSAALPASTASLEGRVIGPTGTPLAGARVEAWTADPIIVSERVALAATGADGWFRLERLPLGPLAIRAAHPGHYTRAPVVIDVRRGHARAPDLRLAKSAAIRGTVRDAAGAPVKATLIAGDASAESDARGAFVLDGLEPNRMVDLWVDGGAHGSMQQPVRAGTANVAIALRSVCRSVRLLVEGQPLVGRRAMVRWSRDGETQVGASSTPGEDSLRMCAAPGSYNLGVEVDGRATWHAAGVKVPGGELVIDLPPGLAVAGRVRDPDGQAIADAEIVISPRNGSPRPLAHARARTDDAGRFLVAGFAMEPLDLDVRADGFLPGQVCLDGPREEIEAVLEWAGVVPPAPE